MREIAEHIELISKASGSNAKKYYLARAANVPGFKDVMKFIYNPYVKTGISTAKLNSVIAYPNHIVAGDYMDIIDYFTTHQTGRDADVLVAKAFIAQVKKDNLDYPFAVTIAKALVTQKLTIGVTATSLNAVYGADFIPKTGCMLGTQITKMSPNQIQWPCIVTEKLDGIRRLLVKEGKTIRMYSRSGHEDFGLVEIMEEAKHLPTNMVYDGELLALGDFSDSIALRQASMSRAAINGDKTGLSFNIFDMLPLEEYNQGESTDNAEYRKIRLGATLNDPTIAYLREDFVGLIMAYRVEHLFEFIKSVPILGVVKNMKEVEPIVASIWAKGGEGVMLNTTVGKYQVDKRTKDLLKVKKTEEYELMVVDIIEGSGKYEDMMGALVVDYKGTYLGVGSGFTDAQREEIWYNWDEYKGRIIEIDSFGESQNMAGGTSLNCPIFKRFKESD